MCAVESGAGELAGDGAIVGRGWHEWRCAMQLQLDSAPPVNAMENLL